MKALNRILVAHDLTEVGEDVLTEARGLARTFGAQLVFLHAIPEAPESSQDFDALAYQVEDLFRDLRARLGEEGVEVASNFVVHAGAPAEVILDHARALDADLVMLGSGEKGALERLVLGSTAEKVIRRAQRPVWLVRPGKPHARIERIACACDASDPAREALATAIFLARTYVARLSLITVVPEPRAGQPLDEEGALVRSCARELDLHGLDVEFLVRAGDPAEQVVEAATAAGADLLVLGSAGRTGFSRLLHGNTAEKVARRVPCSVLAVSPARGR